MEISTALANKLADDLIEINGVRCYFCQSKLDRKHIRSVDFIVPLSKGGELTVDNAILCCKECSARRRRRHMVDYVTERLIEIDSEYQRLHQLKQALTTAHLAGRNATEELASAPVAKPKAVQVEDDYDEGAVHRVVANWEDDDYDEGAVLRELADS